MKADYTYILSFLKHPNQFVIPIYQRNYAWDIKQCEQLWNDIVKAGKGQVDSHFTGSIVYVQNGAAAAVGGSFLIIDGQQRLTTTLLLLEALRRSIGGKEYSGLNEREIKSYIIDSNKDDDRKYKIVLSENDNESVKTLFDGRDISKLQNDKVSANIKTNFNFFMKKLSTADLEIICQGLVKLAVVEVALVKGQDDPQLIFESMNSTGKSLSQADLIRNNILMGLDAEAQKEVYQNHWRPMEISFGQEAYNKDFDAFMRHYLTVKLLRIPKIDEVYDVFKNYARTSGLTAEEIVEDIENFSQFYAVINYDKESGIKEIDEQLKHRFVNLIQKMKYTVSMPIILMLYSDYHNEVIDVDDFRECFDALESYIFRRSVVGLPPNSLNKTFESMLSRIDKKNYVESFKYNLLSLETYRGFPSDAEFKEALVSRELYGMPILKHLLDRLENYGRKPEESVDISECTIEHVLPQNDELIPDWKNMLGANHKEVQEKYLHTLGNLTLTSYNSEYSDKSYNAKQYFTNKNTGAGIGLANSPYNLNSYFRSTNIWTENEIIERADMLSDIALNIWKKPKTVIPIVKTVNKSREDKITVVNLIEAGYLSVGEKLYSTEPKHQGEATILDDGTVEFDSEIGLTLSAAGLKLIRQTNPDRESCGGWDFWATRDEDGELKSLKQWSEDYRNSSRD